MEVGGVVFLDEVFGERVNHQREFFGRDGGECAAGDGLRPVLGERIALDDDGAEICDGGLGGRGHSDGGDKEYRGVFHGNNINGARGAKVHAGSEAAPPRERGGTAAPPEVKHAGSGARRHRRPARS